MTNEEAKKMLKAKLECLKHETSGTDYACNQHLCEGCSLNYEQGNMGEQKEALEIATKALEQQRWIPVSEPPKKSGEYFVDSTFGMAVVEYDADIKSFGWWREEYDCDTLACVDREFIKTEEVLAWQPLPQPYKEEQDGK